MTADDQPELDAVVVGAGFSGLYMLHRLRDTLGLRARVFEAADVQDAVSARHDVHVKPSHRYCVYVRRSPPEIPRSP